MSNTPFTIIYLTHGLYAVEYKGKRLKDNYGRETCPSAHIHAFKIDREDYIAFTEYFNGVLGVRAGVLKVKAMPCGEADKSV